MDSTIKRKKDHSVLKKRDKIYKKIIEYGILGLILFSPLPAASVYEWSILVIQLAVLVMVAAYLLINEKPKINPHLSQRLKWPKYLFTAFFIFIFFQILPLPHFLVKILNPHTYSFQNQFSHNISQTKFMSLSIVPFSTLQEGLELLSYVLLGFLIIKTVTKRYQFRRIYFALVSIGLFEAFYGLYELYRTNPRILFYKKSFNLGSVTGTFFNQNHLSGYLEMIIPLAIGIVLARTRILSPSRKKLSKRIIHLAEKNVATNFIVAVAIITMAIAIVLSKSRSGFFLLGFTFILFTGFSFLYFGTPKRGYRKIRRLIYVMFLLVIIFSLYVGVDATLERFAQSKPLEGGRPIYWKNMTATITDFPLVGTGLGTFASVYPAYDNTVSWGLLPHAHNDYLEYLSELGVVGFLLLFGGILYLIIQAYLIWLSRREPEVKGLALGGIVALIVIAIHSITDFNLHIPANMLLFSVVLSITIVTATHRKGEKLLDKKTHK